MTGSWRAWQNAAYPFSLVLARLLGRRALVSRSTRCLDLMASRWFGAAAAVGVLFDAHTPMDM